MIAIYAMKKIMFDDKYGLTKAVLEGRKTMTRRLPNKAWRDIMPGLAGEDLSHASTPFKVGDVVAVAQNYRDAGLDPKNCDKFQLVTYGDFPSRYNHGWANKMFVLADLMPHQIRITNVRVERLQDISDEECLKEGISKSSAPGQYYVDGLQRPMHNDGVLRSFTSPRDAFAELIDRLSGKGTWESNPWVFVYEFELVK